jgi:hypothetical protein
MTTACTVKPLSIVSEENAKINECCRKVIYIGDVHGPEKVNDISVKTMQAGTMDRGFIVNILSHSTHNRSVVTKPLSSLKQNHHSFLNFTGTLCFWNS